MTEQLVNKEGSNDFYNKYIANGKYDTIQNSFKSEILEHSIVKNQIKTGYKLWS